VLSGRGLCDRPITLQRNQLSVVCLSVIEEPNRGCLSPLGLLSHGVGGGGTGPNRSFHTALFLLSELSYGSAHCFNQSRLQSVSAVWSTMTDSTKLKDMRNTFVNLRYSRYYHTFKDTVSQTVLVFGFKLNQSRNNLALT
jgi:hypothetical protein